MWPSGFGADNENFVEWLGFHAFLDVLGDSLEGTNILSLLVLLKK
mgnify:CR=1 FL=1